MPSSTPIAARSRQALPQDAPKTIENFIGLATGQKPGPTRAPARRPTSPSITARSSTVHPRLHDPRRDPLGTGTAVRAISSKTFSNRTFDKAGLWHGECRPNTNGSQFFITMAPTPWLNASTRSWRVVEGMPLAEAIVNSPRSRTA